jgi:hypothetical protein
MRGLLKRFRNGAVERLSILSSSRTRAPEKRSEPTLRFLCEQDGAPERELKAELHEVLRSHSAVIRAYLARVDYGNPSAYEVALCISSPKDETLVKQVSQVFARRFGQGAHLDIIFLTSNTEAEVKKVCRAFYEAG